jgi:hypothetical protein
VAQENENAIAFYEHLGFAVLQAGVDSLYMGMRLPRPNVDGSQR